jgi:hypothetical protein
MSTGVASFTRIEQEPIQPNKKAAGQQLGGSLPLTPSSLNNT